MKRPAFAGSCALALALLLVLARVERRAVAVDLSTERDLHGQAYAGSAACRRCHAIVSRAIGSRRHQQYLTRIGDAEYRLPIAYHVEEERWFQMNGAFLFSEKDFAPARPRHAALDRVRAALRPSAVIPTPPAALHVLRAASVAAAIEIGE